MHEHHDHSQTTHSAGCDACSYVAETHAHDDDMAAWKLSEDLAEHNQQEHNEDTVVEEIVETVKAKMARLS